MSSRSKRFRHFAAASMLVALTGASATGCKGDGLVGLLITNQQEVELGAGVDEQIMMEYKILEDSDPAAVWARELVSSLTPAADAHRPQSEFGGYKVKVIYDNNLVNAFAAPGGYVYIVSGLILSAQTCAEVAGVVGHELAHVTQRHSVKKLAKSSLFSTLTSVILNEGITQTVINTSYEVLQNTAFSRRDESESDKVGSEIMYEAGYNPYALADMFETLKEQAGGSAGRFIQFFSSHPDPGNRAERIRDRIASDWDDVAEDDSSTYFYDCVGTTRTLDEIRGRLSAGTVSVRPGTGVNPPAAP